MMMTARYVVVEKDGSAVALDVLITPELQSEGIINEITHQANSLRKEQGYNVTEKVELFFNSDNDDVINAICFGEGKILSETQASKLHIIPQDTTVRYTEYTLMMYKANVLPPEKISFGLAIGLKGTLDKV